MRIVGLLVLLCVFLSNPNAGAQGLPETYSYVFPAPGSEYIHPGTTVILRFRGIDPHALVNLHKMIRVSGEKAAFFDKFFRFSCSRPISKLCFR